MLVREYPTVLSDKRFILGCALLGLLAMAFWSGSRYPALNEKALMGSTTNLSALGFDTIVEVSADDSLVVQIVYNTLNWMYTNKMGMLFGLLFAAMLSSPTLNIIVLTMLFALFPTYLAVIKVCLTLGFILIVIPLLTRFVPTSPTAEFEMPVADSTAQSEFPPFMAACEIASPKEWSNALLWVGRNFSLNLWFIVKTTVPLMILAGFLGSALITVLPFESLAEFIPERGRLLTLVIMGVIGLIGTFLPVPMAFDVIVVAILVQAGLPMKFAAILLFTLGIFSVYSFSIVWQSISRWHAALIFGLVAAVGVAAGVGSHYANEWQLAREKRILFDWAQNQLFVSDGPQLIEQAPVVYAQAEGELVDSLIEQALLPAFVLEQNGLSVSRLPFQARTMPVDSSDMAENATWFSRYDGRNLGLDDISQFSILDVSGAFGQFRGIAAGDIHHDGWIDVLLTTENGLALYANQQGQGFIRQEIPGSTLDQYYVVNAALVDLNSDGWLDIYLSTYRQGNHVLYSQAGRFSEETLQTLPNLPEALTTAATTFGDIDEDGDLDIALGNWSIGELTTNFLSFEHSRNAWLRNDGDGFFLHPLNGVSGETLSMLFTDFNQDNDLDLLVGNDFNPADTYYLGDGKGGLHKVTPTDELIPHSTRWTMSFATTDINNDLTTEIYVGQISAGQPVVRSNEEICAEYEDEQLRQQCLRTRRITDVVERSNKKQNVSACLSLEPKDQDDCLAYYMLMAAVYRVKDRSYCDAFPDAWAEFTFLCKFHFDAPSTRVGIQPKGEIPSVTDPNAFLMLDETGRFVDKAKELGLTVGGWGWNAKFADLNLDEWQDLYLVSGYIAPIGPEGDFDSNYLYQNQSGQKFVDRTEAAGLGSALETLSYTYIDIDHDGDLDIISVPMFGPVWVYINQTDQGNAIMFELRDQAGNRFGVGSKIIVHYGDGHHQMREIQAGGGYLSFDAPIAHFGMGAYDVVSMVEVIWSTGERSEITGDFATGARYIITRQHIQ